MRFILEVLRYIIGNNYFNKQRFLVEWHQWLTGSHSSYHIFVNWIGIMWGQSVNKTIPFQLKHARKRCSYMWTITLSSYFSVVVCLICLLRHILLLIAYTVRVNWECVFIIIVQSMMSANSRIRFGLKIVFVYLHITSFYYRHCANLSRYIGLIKCLSDILSSVWVR